jgi:anion-transporting  ArsA/GET3 family ATPase
VNDLGALARERHIVVCAGSGGVGKTTTAAAIAIEGARAGRKACVVTIDPAKRLANALGLASLSNTPGRIDGPWPGELSALMLDTKSTFDALVSRHAGDPAQAERILENRFYRNISGALSGTQEYMAMEKLYELHADSDFDLIVVDTPPTRNALDFLDAPRRLTRFLDNRVFRWLMMPTKAYLKAVNVATQAFLRTVSKVVGTEVIQDAVQFFTNFEGMEQGFRDRAQRVLELLSDEGTAFVLVASPRRDAIEEALFFAEKLGESDIPVDALVVNRLHPTFDGDIRGSRLDAAGDLARAEALAGTALGVLYRNLAEFRAVAVREREHLAGLERRVAPAPVAEIPFLPSDVHDLDGLTELGRHLFAAR